MTDMTECDWSTLPKATCSHCTGSKLPKGLEEEDDFRDYRTQAERLMERDPWEVEIEESLDGQRSKLRLGWAKKGQFVFPPNPRDMEWEDDEEGVE